MLNDGVGCTIDTCSEVMDTVLHVADDALCDDGLFCNGIETCDPVDDCLTSDVPVIDDGVPCTDDSCDETNDVVVNLPNDGLCLAGDMCTASQTCDVVAGCVTGPPVDPDDGVTCTVDDCDPATGVTNTPDDGACDDGLFCNGMESCDAINDCQPGMPPQEDNDPCTVDFCDEATDTVTNNAAGNGFICGTSPRSICLGGNCQASVCGDGFVDPGLGEECDPPGATCTANCQDNNTCDPDDTWTISSPVDIDCDVFIYTLSIDLDTVILASGASSGIGQTGRRFTGESANFVPMAFVDGNGGTCPSGSFTIEMHIDANGLGCDERYTIDGTFTGQDTFTGTFTAQFTSVGGAGFCGTCATSQTAISGTRQ